MIHLLADGLTPSAAPVFGGIAVIDSSHVKSVDNDDDDEENEAAMEVREDTPVGTR